jgi:hypothetical protein
MLDHGPVAAFDPDPVHAMAAQQRGDLRQAWSRVRHGGFVDALAVVVDDAQCVVLPGPVDPGVS